MPKLNAALARWKLAALASVGQAPAFENVDCALQPIASTYGTRAGHPGSARTSRPADKLRTWPAPARQLPSPTRQIRTRWPAP